MRLRCTALCVFVALAACATTILVDHAFPPAAAMPPSVPATICLPGEVDGDAEVTIADAVAILRYVFQGGPAPLLPACCHFEEGR